MSKKIGVGVYQFSNRPWIKSFGAVVGKKEGEGPLGDCFDIIHDDTTLGEETWEKAESQMQKDAVASALTKSKLSPAEIDVVFAGDLLNQCISSSYGLRELGIPFYGLYGACSTMAESLSLAGLFADTNLIDNALAVTSSHFCTAERQFRFPLEYGGQRTPTAQWTVTGSGAIVVSAGCSSSKPPYINGICIGKIEDLGIKDINNMGAAMAPAGASTIKRYLNSTKTKPSDYDMIITGDLGVLGSTLMLELLQKDGIDISKNHNDCGKMIYDLNKQDVHSGGSGCGCSASVLCGYLLKLIQTGKVDNLLFIATGALMSPTSIQQGESIPGIAHLVHLSSK